MIWYVASIIVSVRLKDNDNGEISVYENFYLVNGDTPETALEKAVVIGKDIERANNNMTLDDQPAHMVFEGIRKLINIRNPSPLDPDGDSPAFGTELTYSEYIVKNSDQLNALVKGDEVTLTYVE